MHMLKRVKQSDSTSVNASYPPHRSFSTTTTPPTSTSPTTLTTTSTVSSMLSSGSPPAASRSRSRAISSPVTPVTNNSNGQYNTLESVVAMDESSSSSVSSHQHPNHHQHPNNHHHLLDEQDIVDSHTFEGMLDSEVLRPLFKNYLHSILNPEPLDYLEQVELYNSRRSAKNRYQTAVYIINEFLREKSPREINITRKQSTDLIQRFEETCSEDHCPKNLFDEITSAVTLELKEDCFHKFLASSHFLNHVRSELRHRELQQNLQHPDNMDAKSSSDDSLTDDSSVTTPEKEGGKVVDQSFFGGMDRSSPQFTKQDFEYLLNEVHNNDESQWVRINRKSKYEGRSLYLSKHSFTLHSTSGSGNSKKSANKPKYLQKIKEVSDVPYSMEEVFYAVIDDEYTHLLDQGRMKCCQKQFFDASAESQTFASTVYVSQYRMTFPFTNREFTMSSSVARYGENMIVIGIKGLAPSVQFPTSKGFVRAESIGGIVIERIYNDKTRVTYTALLDFGGYIPTKLWNYFMSLRDDSFILGLNQAVNERRKKAPDGWRSVSPKESFGVFETMEQNERMMQAHGITFTLKDTRPL